MGEDEAQLGKTLRQLVKTSFFQAVAIGVLVLIGTWILAANSESPLSTSERLFAIAASFGASAFWWAFLANVNERAVQRVIQHEIAVERKNAAELRRSEINQLRNTIERSTARSDRVPSGIYEGKSAWDLRFNHDLDHFLNNSQTYYFHGPTAVYVGARLRLRDSSERLRHVQVRLTDPTSSLGFRRAVDDRMNRPDHIGKKPPLVEKQLREDIYMSIVALFDAIQAQAAFELRLLLERRPLGERIELFDGALFDASVASTERANFTRTLRWDSKELVYAERAPALKDVTDSRVITFEASTPEDELHEVVDGMGFELDRIGEMRDRYETEYVGKMRAILAAARTYSDEFTLRS